LKNLLYWVYVTTSQKYSATPEAVFTYEIKEENNEGLLILQTRSRTLGRHIVEECEFTNSERRQLTHHFSQEFILNEGLTKAAEILNNDSARAIWRDFYGREIFHNDYTLD
jgi:hypothetical protein